MADDLRLQKLLDVTRQMAEMRALDPLLEHVVKVTLDLFGAEMALVILLRPDGSLDFRAGARSDGQPVRPSDPRISHSILNRVIQEREPVVLADAVSDQEFQTADSVIDLQLRSLMVAPLVSRGTALGAVYLEHRSLKDYFHDNDLRFLQVLANQAAVSIENAILNDELEQRVETRTAELQHSEARNWALLSAIPDLMIRTGRDGTILDVKQGMGVALYRPADEILGHQVREVLPPDVAAEAMRQIEIVLKTGRLHVHEYSLDIDGELRFFESRMVAAREADETLTIIRDITERTRAEQALHTSNDRLLALRQVDDELSRQLDLPYVLKIALDAAIRLSGADTGAIALLESGGQLRVSVASGHYESLVGSLTWTDRGIVRRVLQNRQPELVRDVSADPDYVPYVPDVCAQMTLPLISRERFVGILNLETSHVERFTPEAFEFLKLLAARIAVAIDNAEMYQTEQRQRQIESTLREAARALNETLDLSEVMTRIMEHMQAVVPCDTCSIQRVQGDFLEIIACYGFAEPEHVLGQTFSIIDNQMVNYLVTTHQPIQIEDAAQHPYFEKYRARYPDIKFRTWLGVPLIIRDRFIGQITLDRWTVNPYTPEEIDLALAFADHAAMALENAELYRQQESHTRALERTIEERERLIGELDAFAHTVAHDLKNPLSLMIGYAEMLLGEDLETFSTEKLAASLRSISSGADKMNNIIQALLLLSGVRKAETVRINRLDMGPIISEAQNRLYRQIAQYQPEFVVPEVWPDAQGYAPWVEEVWANYLSNALKYGGRPPRVELGAVPQSDGFVRFWVRDNGHGLTVEEQAQLFTPFTRLSHPDVEGHGLGLSIVQRIVEKLGGQVGVESEVGRGSLFSFTLPGVGQP